MREKLIEYGFSENQAEQLLKGKEVNTFYGVVKYSKSKKEIVTTYHATGKKEVYKL